MELFRLFGTILINDKEAKDAIDGVDKKSEGLGSRLASIGGGALKIGGMIATGIEAAGAGIMKLATQGAETADSIDELSQKVGFSRDGLQQWEYVMGLAGTSMEATGAGIKTMTGKIQELQAGSEGATALFQQLGVTITDSMSQEDAFNTIVTALQGMEDGTQKAALAQDIFGKAALNLMPVLNDTSSNVDALKQKAVDLGMVMSGDTIDAGVKLADTMDTLKGVLQASLLPVMAGVMPVIQELGEAFISYAPQIMAAMGPLFDLLTPAFSQLTTTLLPVLITLFQTIFTEVLPPFMDVVNLIVTEILPPFLDLFGEVIEAILPVLSDLLKMLAETILPPVIGLLKVIIKDVMPVFITLFNEVAKVVLPILKQAFKDLQPAIDALSSILSGLISFVKNVFKGDWKAAWEDVKNIFTSVWDGLKAVFKGTVNQILGMVNAMIRGLNQIRIPDWVPGIGGNGINIREIPLLAEGGHITRGGRAIVGEAGPELLNLPTGATVTPLERAGSGGRLVFERGAFEGLVVMDDYGVDRFMDRIVSRARDLGVAPA